MLAILLCGHIWWLELTPSQPFDAPGFLDVWYELETKPLPTQYHKFIITILMAGQPTNLMKILDKFLQWNVQERKKKFLVQSSSTSPRKLFCLNFRKWLMLVTFPHPLDITNYQTHISEAKILFCIISTSSIILSNICLEMSLEFIKIVNLENQAVQKSLMSQIGNS